MEQEVNLQYAVNALAQQIAQLAQEKAYRDAIITEQQQELTELKQKMEEQPGKP